MNDLSVRLVTDGGPEVGLGHLHRALAVADELCNRGAEVQFLVPGHVRQAGYLLGSGHPVEPLEWWAHDEGLYADRTVWIFDLPDRPWVEYDPPGFSPVGFKVALKKPRESSQLFDLIIDGNPHGQPISLDAQALRICTGLKYAVLRDEFSQVGAKVIRRIARKLLITVGGSDPHRLTRKILHGASKVPDIEKIDVVIGPMFADEAIWVRELVMERESVSLHQDVGQIKPLYEDADLAVIAGGTTLLEIARVGTPAVVMLQSEDQRWRSEALHRFGAIEYLGPGWGVHPCDIQKTVSDLVHDLGRRNEMSLSCRELIDGRGAKRVADEILALVD